MEKWIMRIKNIVILITVFIFNFGAYSQTLNRTTDIKITAEKYLDLAAGILNINQIHTNFYNDGNLISNLGPDALQPALIYRNIKYLRDLPIWVGIPEGEWTPKAWDEQKLDSIGVGPTVSGSYFYYFFPNGTDWGPIKGSRNKSFSGDLLLSDLYKVSSKDDVPLLSANNLPLTWPENIYGERVWNGKWAIDPETGQTIPGKFRADQEIIVDFTDVGYADGIYPEFYHYLNFIPGPLQGYDIGIKAKGSVLAFNESYNNKFFIVELNLVNISSWNYTRAYLSIYFHPQLSIIGTKMGKELWRNKFRHHLNYVTKTYEPSLERDYQYNLAYYFLEILNHPLPENINLPAIGIKLLETPNEPEGEQLGLSGWHWFNNKLVFKGHSLTDSPLKRGELIQYKIISGDTSALLPVEQEHFFYPQAGAVDPDFDKLEEEDLENMSFDAAKTLISSGPFNWNSGDTVRFAFAVVFGDDLEDLKTNCRIAQKMYDNNYRRMGPPTPPNVTAVAGDKQVTLYWNDAAENDKDFLTDYYDFEGYRIYRTSVNPELGLWGEQILDGDGNLVGFVPMAQFDLIDGIEGLDAQYPHLQLGRETGVKHSWTDTTVNNGVTYWYAVCAYDQGITADSLLNPGKWPDFQSLENSRGTDAELYRNLVKVMPGAVPANYKSSALNLMALPGTKGNGHITAEILDPLAITGNTYTVIFDDTTTNELSYSVVNETNNQTLLQQVSQVCGEEGPVFDGIKLTVNTYDDVELLPDSSGWIRWETGDSADCNYRVKAISPLNEPPLNNYEIRFTENGDTSFVFHKIAPFEIWDISNNQRLFWEIFTNSPTDSTDSLKSVWSSGDYVRIREEIDGKLKFSWDFILTRNPTAVYSERDTMIDGYWEIAIDTTIIDNPPQLGDALQLITTKPFHSGDRFCLQTKKVTSGQTTKDELSQIKVVPNPYLVSAAWEQHADDHRLSFTHLPAKCEVIIFNVTGDVVAVLKHDNPYSGSAFWNLQSHEGMEVASGLYLYVVKTAEGKTKDGKFVVIR